MKKKILDNNVKKEIIDLYNQNISKRKISKQFNISTTLLDRILKKELKIYKYNSGDSIKFKENENENVKIFAICKKTNKIFKDYENKSGAITNYIKENYPNFEIPSAYKRREFFIKNGKYWYEEFFTIKKEEIKKIKTKKCSYCDWETIDIENKSGAYKTHLLKKHNITISEHLEKFNEDENYFNTKNLNYTNRFKNKEEKKDFIKCEICNKKLSKITNTHLKKHNITLLEYKLKYGTKNLYSNKTYENILKNYNENLKLSGNNFTSKAQQEISDFLKSNGIQNELNNKKLLNGIEIDILCEKHKIGIEYNGNYYHSEKIGKKDRRFHLNKSVLMKEKEYKLYHIFEDEWLDKSEIIKSKLLQIFNIKENKKIIHARKCNLLELTTREKSDFLEKNHLQGNDKSNIYIGAIINNEIVAVMTFDSKRSMSKKTSDDEYELNRFCTDRDKIITGIASRMLKYFIKNYKPKKIITFADTRWTPDENNNIYNKLNFNYIGAIKPDYSYYNPSVSRNKRFHKFGFGKNSIKRKFPEIYDENKTEWEMMQELGYDRIWDCGKYKYELNIKNAEV
jgi:hypothetical protein